MKWDRIIPTVVRFLQRDWFVGVSDAMRFSFPSMRYAVAIAAALAVIAGLGTASLSVAVLGQPPAAKSPAREDEQPVAPKAVTTKVEAGKGEDAKPEATADDAPTADGKGKSGPAMPPPTGFDRVSKVYEVWIHPGRKMVAVDGRVCLNRGPLEMFACPQKTKEHESIVAVSSDAMTVHAALLAVGAKSGNPVSFNPDYKPATGSRIDIQVLWTDKTTGQRQQVPAQQWIRHSRTKKQLEYNWVFGGSSFFLDEETKKQVYQAESGDLVCVSNFPTATLDLPVESSQANADLEFEAFTERIPPVGTLVRLIFSIGKP
jgi:uncharacterized low-complexity protein